MALFLIVLNSSAQDAYRTNISPAGQWTAVGSWQRFDAGTSTWVAATAIPTSADGVITILAGDSLVLSGAGSNISIDQVVIDPGGVLVIFNNTAGAVNLNNGAGDDISVNGRLYIGGTGNITGSGTIVNNSGGLFTLRNTGVLGAAVINNGNMHMGASGVSAGTISATTVTNNGFCLWIDGNANTANGGSFINNGAFEIQTTGNPFWYTTGSSNSLVNNGTITKTSTNTGLVTIPYTVTNNATGVITNNGGSLSLGGTVSTGLVSNAGTILGNLGGIFTLNGLTNIGTLAGFGAFAWGSSLSNTGFISPGNSGAGEMSINSLFVNNTSATYDIQITSTGAVAGVNYDHVIVTSGGLSLNGSTLNVSIAPNSDPVGTIYEIITAGMSGTFSSVTLDPAYTYTIEPSRVILTKTATLPVSWGSFNAVSKGNKVALDWTTLMEENTSHFIIEHATDPAHFSPVAQVQAKGNSTYTAKYQFTFNTPDLSKTNYFRIKQVDIDGKSSYSATRSVKFDKGLAVAIQVYPNPVKDLLQLNIQRENIQVMLVDQSGRTLQQRSVQPGQSTIDMQSLPTGIYQLVIFEKGIRIDAKKIVKQ